MPKKTAEQFEAERQQQDLERIRNRDDWPHWPWLPLKRRRSSGMELAVLYASNPYQILDTNLFELPTSKEEFQTKNPRNIMPEELVAEGWLVD